MMGVWVRSQDRTGLVIVNDIYVVDCSVWASSRQNSEDRFLGDYCSEEEAIRVLDMIQERIDMTRPESVMAQGKAFQMPKAGFSFCAKEAD